MPAPLLPFVAGAVSASLISSYTSPLLGPTERRNAYLANRGQPNLLPDPQLAIRAFIKGRMSYEQFKPLMLSHGIDVEDNDYAWMNAINANRPFIDIGAIQTMNWRKTLSDDPRRNNDMYNTLAKFAGWGDKGFRDWLNRIPYNWDANTIRIMHALGLLTEQQFRDWCGSVGMVLNEDFEKYKSLYAVPTPSQTNEIFNRGIISEVGMEEWHKLAGLTDPRVRSAMQQLRYKIPSPSELIEFAVKEVWNRDIVSKFGYDDEFDQIPEFKHWMGQQGYSGNPDMPGSPPGGPKTWAQAFWRKHWRNIAPDQAYRMFHRFRPTGGPDGKERVPEAGVFTLDDVAATLKINDYPPYFRNKLTMLSYNVLRLVDIRRIVFLSLRSEKFKKEAIGDGYSIHDWAKENFLDRGQSPRDADTLASLAVYEGRLAKQRLHEKKTAFIRNEKFKVSREEYQIGIATREQTLLRFGEAGLEQDDALDLCNVIDRQFAVSCAKGNIAAVKKMFTKGRASKEDAIKMLEHAGLTKIGAVRWVSCWQSTISEDDIMEETNRVRQAVAAGMMNYSEAIEILTRLGWEDAQTLLENEDIASLVEN